MSDEQVELHFRAIRRRMAALQNEDRENWREIDAVLEDLHVIYEQMQTNLEAAEVVEEELLQHNQKVAAGYGRYHELFQASPIAYLVTDADGVIREANWAIAHLLNLPQRYLIGKPLILYLAKGDRSDFYLKLDRLSQSSGIQIWTMSLRPRKSPLLAVELHVDAVRDDSGAVEELRIGVYNLSRSQVTSPLPQLPQTLDGLRVLVVDDEADARDFVTAVLETCGVGVRAVSSATAALKELEQFHPDVIVSDIRMPGEDGYSLIRQIRALEAGQGRHVPAAAITAYLDEDREKALTAGFEAHLHKLAQPTELLEVVAQLAGRRSEL